MAESTLTLTYDNLAGTVGYYLGYGTESANWSVAQTAQIDDIVQAGYRQFLAPPPVDGKKHTWSFLTPVASFSTTAAAGTLSTAVHAAGYTTITATTGVFGSGMVDGEITFDTSENAYTIYSYTSPTVIVVEGDASGEAGSDTFTIPTRYCYDLPDDFGGIEGELTYDANQAGYSVPIRSELEIRRQRATAAGSGQPQLAAVRPKPYVATVGQRYELLIWPATDGVYKLFYRYRVIPDALDSTDLYPLGGMEHGETIRESCLAVAEAYMDDTQGIHQARFLERLRASVILDARQAPRNYGYNGDQGGDVRVWDRVQYVYVNGILPS